MALQELTIRNFAIIKQLDIELAAGLTVITGETGAGKSIMLDALDLLLGARAESSMLRHGQDQCEISALFSILELDHIHQWLAQRDLADAQKTCLIRRIVRANKPTKCYINDQPTTLASLRELGMMLVDLHGQHEHQSLMRVADQRRIIDQFAGHSDALKSLAKLASTIHRLQRQLDALSQGHNDNADRMELMSFQLNELNEADISEGEFETLEQEHSRLSNAQELIDGIEEAVDALFHNENSNVSAELGRSIKHISDLLEFDTNLKPANDLLNSALAQIEEAQSALNSALGGLEHDPERLREVEQRRDTLINLARKHRCSENQLPAKHQALQAEYQRLEADSCQPEKLEQQISDLKASYFSAANKVSARRTKIAKQLSAAITEQMQDLGMQGGQLEIVVEPQISDQPLVTEHGIDQIEFRVSTNHGMPLKALNKTASGGELSRISLAIQVITSEKSDTPTLVFDEVDVGVGGKVAQIVGAKLRNLGKNAQVICITHLPQVAAQGQQHFFIDKVTTDSETYSTLITLEDELRTAEIARMLGGEIITDRTRAHAQEMLAANS